MKLLTLREASSALRAAYAHQALFRGDRGTHYSSGTPRVDAYDEDDNEQARQDRVDLLEEERELAASRTAIYQQGLRRYHSRRVKSRSFNEGDLVLRLIQKSEGMHKLSAPWEGPFVVSKVLGNGSYYLIDICEADKSSKSEEKQNVHGTSVCYAPFTHSTL